MKYYFNLTTVVLLTICIALFSSSCSNDLKCEELIKNNQEVENSKLINELISINNALLSQPHTTRGWTTKEAINVAVADFSGAYGGAKAGGKMGFLLELD